MKALFVLIVISFTSVVVYAQPNIPDIHWKFYSSEKGDLKVPNGGVEQTSDAVFDIDKDGINDFIISERTHTPSLVWYKKNGKKFTIILFRF